MLAYLINYIIVFHGVPQNDFELSRQPPRYCNCRGSFLVQFISRNSIFSSTLQAYFFLQGHPIKIIDRQIEQVLMDPIIFGSLRVEPVPVHFRSTKLSHSIPDGQKPRMIAESQLTSCPPIFFDCHLNILVHSFFFLYFFYS